MPSRSLLLTLSTSVPPGVLPSNRLPPRPARAWVPVQSVTPMCSGTHSEKSVHKKKAFIVMRLLYYDLWHLWKRAVIFFPHLFGSLMERLWGVYVPTCTDHADALLACNLPVNLTAANLSYEVSRTRTLITDPQPKPTPHAFNPGPCALNPKTSTLNPKP